MRRFGDPESFLGLLDQVRALAPTAGVRSNVIVGFPGETDDDLQTLCDFLVAARLDVTGVFGYSDEDGTEAAGFDGKLDDDEIRARVEHVTDLVEQLTADRAEERIGEQVVVLVESVEDADERRAPRVAPTTRAPRSTARTRLAGGRHAVGDLVPAVVVASRGRRPGRGADPMTERGRHVRELEPAQRPDRAPDPDRARSSASPCSTTAATRSSGARVAAVLFFVAMVTDKVDGDIARSRGLVTNFGKIADPIADKAMTGMAFVGLSIVGDIWWWVTIVVLLREWSVTLLRLSILKQVVVAAAQSGKVKTVLQAVALTGLSPAAAPAATARSTTSGVVLFYALRRRLLAVAVAMTLWSGYEFFRDVWRQRESIRAT